MPWSIGERHAFHSPVPMKARSSSGQTEELAALGDLSVDCVSLSVSVSDCASRLSQSVRAHVYDRIRRTADHVVECTSRVISRYGLGTPRICITLSPVSRITAAHHAEDFARLADTLEAAARDVGAKSLYGLTAFPAADPDIDPGPLVSTLRTTLASCEALRAVIGIASTSSGLHAEALLGAADAVGNLSRTGNSPISPAARLVFGANLDPGAWMHDGSIHWTGAHQASLNISVNAGSAVHAPGTQSPEEWTNESPAEQLRRTGARLSSLGRSITRTICADLECLGGAVVMPGRAAVLSRSVSSLGASQVDAGSAHTGEVLQGGLDGHLVRRNLADGAAVVAGPPTPIYGSVCCKDAVVPMPPGSGVDQIATRLGELLRHACASGSAAAFTVVPSGQVVASAPPDHSSRGRTIAAVSGPA